ncbi:hypothetical protein BGW39_005607 [Mortierella sp. 14UC]|nr:hypothetical protein BGW39_005607 [Mortierella sp. 14UC]
MTEPSNLELQSPHGELRTAFYNPYDIKRRRRTSRSQFKTLERAFSENPKPNASTRELLAERLSMTPRGIQVWFQNRRAKNKQANTAAHQTNTKPCTDDQPLEDDLGPESDPCLVLAESGPAEDESSSIHPSLTLTVKSFNALGEPPTAKKAQATTRSDSMTSEVSSSVLSVELLAVKSDTIHFRHSPDDNGSTLDIESLVAWYTPEESRHFKETKLKANSLPRISYNGPDDTGCPQATVHSESFATNVHAGNHADEQ